MMLLSPGARFTSGSQLPDNPVHRSYPCNGSERTLQSGSSYTATDSLCPSLQRRERPARNMDESCSYALDHVLHAIHLDTDLHLLDKRLGHLVRPSVRYLGLWTYVYNSEKVCGSLTYTCGAAVHDVHTLASIPAGAGWRGHSVYWRDRTKTSVEAALSTHAVVIWFSQGLSALMQTPCKP